MWQRETGRGRASTPRLARESHINVRVVPIGATVAESVELHTIFTAACFAKCRRPPFAFDESGPREHPVANDSAPHYILKVERDCSSEELTRAWRDLVKQWHPDKLEKMAPECTGGNSEG